MGSVDIFVPCCNYGRFLPECVRSVQSQDICDLRILIIDDASHDDTFHVASALAREDSRIEISRHRSNGGHIATYNEGLNWVRAPYGLLLSADDVLAPGALARALQVMAAASSVGMVHGRSIRFHGQPPTPDPQHQEDLLDYHVVEGTTFTIGQCRRPANPIETATALFRTSIQKRIGGYRVELPHSGDLEMWLRFAAVSDIAYISNVQAFTRIHEANMQHSYREDRAFLDLQQRALAFRFMHEEGADGRALPRGLHNLARRGLAQEALWAAARAFEDNKLEVSRRLVRTGVAIWPRITCSLLYFKVALRMMLGHRAWQQFAQMVRKPERDAPEGSASAQE